MDASGLKRLQAPMLQSAGQVPGQDVSLHHVLDPQFLRRRGRKRIFFA
jgi:hypothetical protein